MAISGVSPSLSFEYPSVIRGYHEYKAIWCSATGEVLVCTREVENLHDPYAVAVEKAGTIVGHLPRKISSICNLFLRKGGSILCTVTGSRQYSADLPQGGLEVPCLLLFNGNSQIIDKAKSLLQLSSVTTTKTAVTTTTTSSSKSSVVPALSTSESITPSLAMTTSITTTTTATAPITATTVITTSVTSLPTILESITTPSLTSCTATTLTLLATASASLVATSSATTATATASISSTALDQCPTPAMPSTNSTTLASASVTVSTSSLHDFNASAAVSVTVPTTSTSTPAAATNSVTSMNKFSAAEVIDLLDETTDEYVCDSNPVTPEKQKMKLNSEKQKMKLNSEELSRIMYGSKLTDLSAQRILREQFELNGLQSTLLQARSNKQIGLNNQLQIIHSHGNSHWIVASSVNSSNQTVLVYDSVFEHLDKNTEKIIQNLFNSRRIKIVKSQTQLGGDDCGVFAIANATTIAHGFNPVNMTYNQNAMRWHLLKCFKEEKMTMFPTLH